MSTYQVVNMIRSEVLVPAVLARPASLGIRNTIGMWAADLDISGTIYACGPHKAVLYLDESDVNTLAPYKAAWDVSGHTQRQRATALALEKFLRVSTPCVRVTARDCILTFVAVQS